MGFFLFIPFSKFGGVIIVHLLCSLLLLKRHHAFLCGRRCQATHLSSPVVLTKAKDFVSFFLSSEVILFENFLFVFIASSHIGLGSTLDVMMMPVKLVTDATIYMKRPKLNSPCNNTIVVNLVR
jgi:hypothetical protein